MKRGDFYRVYRGAQHDPKSFRIYLILSRQNLVDSPFSTVICAPVYSNYREDITTQIEVGVDEGLKHDSAIYCDDLASIPKYKLTDYVGSISEEKMETVNNALRIALALD
jgi:mRNA interferase MazF